MNIIDSKYYFNYIIELCAVRIWSQLYWQGYFNNTCTNTCYLPWLSSAASLLLRQGNWCSRWGPQLFVLLPTNPFAVCVGCWRRGQFFFFTSSNISRKQGKLRQHLLWSYAVTIQKIHTFHSFLWLIPPTNCIEEMRSRAHAVTAIVTAFVEKLTNDSE